ncbi:MAG: mechanosensitive ion channel family protein [Cyanobacteria bacterium SID2]|nr:mechanosensitive ion channel family protein [Cyanobacteria bacterium SID2]
MSGSSLPTPWSVRPLRSVLSSLRWISLALCTTLLVLNAPSIARSQGLFLPTSSESSHSNISWWETNKSYTCGRLSCSDVILYGNITPSLTIAANPITEDEQTISLQSRAGLIQEAFFALFQRTRTYRVENPPPQPLELPEDNLLSDDPERLLHPYTPKIAVGIENQQVVVFVDQQKGFARQTLATVTRIDAIHNGTTTEELAKKWRDLMRRQLSDLLWGSEYDDRNPGARQLLVFKVALVAICTISLLHWLSRWLKKRERAIRQELHQLKNSVKLVNPEGEPTENLDAASQPQSLRNVFHRQTVRHDRVTQILQAWFDRFPKLAQSKRTLLLQRLNGLGLAMRAIFGLQVFSIYTILLTAAFVFPSLRSYVLLISIQVFLLPLLWLGITIADKISDVAIDYMLDRWAEDAQALDPHSQRYALRVGTYSPALKGFSTFVFILLGLYGTVTLLGINPGALAGAAVVAAVVAYISQDLIRDGINGALILWTDRYAVGDVISVLGITGLVENMNLYITQIRASEGRLVTIPNGKIVIVENLTKDWSRVEFKIEIAYTADVKRALEIIREVSEQMQKEVEWRDKILEPPAILGVDNVTHQGVLIQVWIQTLAMQQWAVGREFRLRVKLAFDREGIDIGVPQRQVWYTLNEAFFEQSKDFQAE